MGEALQATLNTASFEQTLATLPGRANPAIARALNRSADSAKTVMVRAIATDLAQKVGTVRDLIRISPATPERLTATFYASPKRIPLISFGARGPEPSRGRGRGVTAKLPGGAGRYPQAFIATMGSGHRGVFQRSTTKRLPVYELRGPSIARAFHKTVGAGIARAQEQMFKNLRSELRYVLRKAA